MHEADEMGSDAVAVGLRHTCTCANGHGYVQGAILYQDVHPVVGKGAEYETTSRTGSDSKVRTMDMGIVGKESVDGKDGYWMEMMMSDPGGKTILGKMLMTPDDFQFHKMIFQMPGKSADGNAIRPDRGSENEIGREYGGSAFAGMGIGHGTRGHVRLRTLEK